MIRSFQDSQTEKLFVGLPVPAFANFERTARRKLEMLNATQNLQDLRIPPANRLEKLKGKRPDFYSIRINDQWRICFLWKNGNAFEVEIIDYH